MLPYIGRDDVSSPAVVEPLRTMRDVPKVMLDSFHKESNTIATNNTTNHSIDRRALKIPDLRIRTTADTMRPQCAPCNSPPDKSDQPTQAGTGCINAIPIPPPEPRLDAHPQQACPYGLGGVPFMPKATQRVLFHSKCGQMIPIGN